MRALLLAALIFSGPAAVCAQDDSEPAPTLTRALLDLRLGDEFARAQRAYPPAQEWPFAEKRGVKRYRIDRGAAKSYPPGVETFSLGFKKGRLVEIELIYDQKRSQEKAVEKLAAEYALTYGTPHRSGERFWWSDGRTVLRVFPAEVAAPGSKRRAVSWRTAIQLFDRSLPDSFD